MFYKIKNSDGKCWLMPMRDVRMGLALYQPSGWKGRLLKQLFPYVHWSKLVRKVLNIELVEHVLQDELKEVICRAFGVEEFRYSVFEGTPSVHQKTTIQVWNGEKILGYVKLTESEEVGRLFEREEKFLSTVNSQQSTVNSQLSGIIFSPTEEKSRRDDIIQTGVRTPDWGITSNINPVGVTDLVPKAVVFRLESGATILIQTTRKTLRSEVVHEWGALQQRFVDELYEKTVQEIRWEESDVAQSLSALREHIDWLPEGVDRDVVLKKIDDVVEKMRGQSVKYGAYHADFTPWNMFVEGGELFVFDWEYAGRKYPKGLDRYHFWMQTALFEKHWSVEELKRYMCSDDGKWIDREMLEMYLLDIMSKYVMREGGKVDELGLFGVWCEMVKGK